VCTVQCREALCVNCTVWRCNVSTLQSLEGHCVCVLHGLDRHFVCIALSSEALCVNCTVKRGTVFVLHSVERHCVCT